jgi:hypothetical protein
VSLNQESEQKCHSAGGQQVAPETGKRHSEAASPGGLTWCQQPGSLPTLEATLLARALGCKSLPGLSKARVRP